MFRLSFTFIGLVFAVPLAFGAGGPAALAQSAQPDLKWAACGDVADTECTGLQVPIDYANPEGAKITLRLGRAPSADPAKRKGAPAAAGRPRRGDHGDDRRRDARGAAHPRIPAAV